jgi:hypothetical protein
MSQLQPSAIRLLGAAGTILVLAACSTAGIKPAPANTVQPSDPRAVALTSAIDVYLRCVTSTAVLQAPGPGSLARAEKTCEPKTAAIKKIGMSAGATSAEADAGTAAIVKSVHDSLKKAGYV